MANKQIKQICVFALAACGDGISGGDRIFIEFARRWAKIYPIKIYVWQEGYKMCQRQGLNVSNIKYQTSSMYPWRLLGFFINYIFRIIEGIRIALSLKLEDSRNTIIYSASEFWMDSIPTFLLKLRYPQVSWVAAWFQTAPNPLKGFAEGRRLKRYRLRSLAYFLIQFPVKIIINRFANFILVNNEEEKKQFPSFKKKGRVIVVLGAVDTKESKRWFLKFKNLPKVYDGVFQGRFHPQKGILELIDIWKLVVSRKKDAKLVMIGDGPLMDSVKLKIKNSRLENNIKLMGYLFDGEEKFKIFSQSKFVVHPAFYDSGGMAAAEAMAFCLPAIGFRLKSFKSYYPSGMIKIEIGNLEDFASGILDLLNNEVKRKKIGNIAYNMINKNWSWDTRAQEVLNILTSIVQTSKVTKQ